MRALLVIAVAAAARRGVHAAAIFRGVATQWLPQPVNTAMNCAARPDSPRDPGCRGRPSAPGAGVMHVAHAGSVWLNRLRLLCVLVVESETTTAARRGPRPGGRPA